MFSRSKKKTRSNTVKTVKRQARIFIVEPEQEIKMEQKKPINLATAKISMVKPEDGLMIQVDETEGEEDE